MTKEFRTAPRTIFFFHIHALHKYKDEHNNQQAELTTIDVALDKVMQLDFGDDEKTTAVFKHGNTYIAMTVDDKGKNYYAGQLANVRERAFPKGLRDGKLVNLDFRGMRLYEPAHFVYFTESKILVLEFNSHAPRHAAFASYISKISKKFGLKPNEVTVNYDLGKETVDRFMKASGRVKGLKVTVPLHSYSTTPKGNLMGMLDGILSNADANRMAQITMEIKFEEAEQEDGPKISRAEAEAANRSDISNLWRSSAVDFSAFLIDMEGSQDFDFITDKVKQEITVQLTDLGHVDTRSIHQEMKAAYTTRYVPSR